MENNRIEYCEFRELEERGIVRTVDLGTNDFGFRERVIICADGTQWDYIPEDGIYEQRINNLITVR